MNDKELAKEIVDRLNRLMADEGAAKALERLIDTRIPVDPILEDHPTIQVSGPEGNPVVGFLGMLNGIVGASGTNEWGYIAANYNPEDLLTGFVVLSDD